MQMISSAAVGSINIYQRYVSPYKGFRCAHRVQNCGLSCSEYAKQSIISAGILAAFPLIFRRFKECREAYEAYLILRQQELSGQEKEKTSPLPKQGDTCVNICTLPCL